MRNGRSKNIIHLLELGLDVVRRFCWKWPHFGHRNLGHNRADGYFLCGSGFSVQVRKLALSNCLTVLGPFTIFRILFDWCWNSISSDQYYRAHPMVQQDFGIVINRQVNVLASTGVQLFITRYHMTWSNSLRCTIHDWFRCSVWSDSARPTFEGVFKRTYRISRWRFWFRVLIIWSMTDGLFALIGHFLW